MSRETIVSVIIPVHNRTDLLKRCLESVAGQTYMDIEVIIIDDASTENILPVVDSIQWGKIPNRTVIRLEKNIGPGGAREVGRQNSQGDYIAYLDSDDIWLPEFLEKNVNNLIRNPDTDFKLF